MGSLEEVGISMEWWKLREKRPSSVWGGKESYRFTKMVREASEVRAFQRFKGGSLRKAGTLARVSVISAGRGPRIWANRRPCHQRRLERGRLRQVKQLRHGWKAQVGDFGFPQWVRTTAPSDTGFKRATDTLTVTKERREWGRDKLGVWD